MIFALLNVLMKSLPISNRSFCSELLESGVIYGWIRISIPFGNHTSCGLRGSLVTALYLLHWHPLWKWAIDASDAPSFVTFDYAFAVKFYSYTSQPHRSGRTFRLNFQERELQEIHEAQLFTVCSESDIVILRYWLRIHATDYGWI